MFKFLSVLCFLAVTSAFAKEVKIGVLIGNKKPGIRKTQFTKNFYEAVKLAKKKYEKQLSTKGITVSFKIYEMEEDPLKNYYPMKQALQDGMDLMLGPSVSYYIPGIYYALEEAKTPIPVISPYAQSELLLKSKHMNSMLSSDSTFGTILKSFLKKNFKEPKMLIVCATDIEISKYQCDTIPREIKKESIFIETDKNLSNIEKIKAAVKRNKIDLIITTNRIPISGVLIKELELDNYEGTYIGSSSLGEVKAAGLLDVVGHSRFHAYAIRENSVHDLKSGKHQDIIEKLREPWGHPRLTSLLFYDATAMVMETILRSPDDFKKQVINNKSYKGILADRTSPKSRYNVIEIKGGNFTHVGSYEL